MSDDGDYRYDEWKDKLLDNALDIPDNLPQDYQDHIDGKNETLAEKMHRLDHEMSVLMSKINNKPIF